MPSPLRFPGTPLKGAPNLTTLPPSGLRLIQGDESVALVGPPASPINAYILPPGGSGGETARFGDSEESRAIKLIKIDIEGTEESVWSGLQSPLENGRPGMITLEFNSGRYADPTDFFGRPCTSGFTLHHLTSDMGIVPTDVSPILGQPGPEDVMLVPGR